MSDRLSRTRSSIICGAAFVAAVIVLFVIPVIGLFISSVTIFGSPIAWVETLVVKYCASSYVGQAPPRYLMMLFESMGHPAFDYVRFAGPFLLYGLVLGMAFPLESGSKARMMKSLAIRFVFTLLVVSLVGTCLGMFAFGLES